MQALSGRTVQGSRAGGGVSVQRHALDEHVPALSGPLGVACAEGAAGSFLEWAEEEDEAVSLCVNWYHPRHCHISSPNSYILVGCQQ